MTTALLNLISLIAIIFLSYLGGELVGKLRLPKVLGYLLVGMIIGPYALGLVDPAYLIPPSSN
jgi:Kef-type K+ transport system membrane component KefB